MKKVKLFAIILLAAIFAGNKSEAQYNTIPPFAIGLRGSPDGGGANLRLFFNDLISVEGQFNVSGGTQNGSGKSMVGVGLLQFNAMLNGPAFRLFVGGGVHYGSWQRYADKSVTNNYFGLDGILGLEYTFHTVPISVSLDAKPAFNFISGATLFPNNMFGLGLRYYIGSWEDYTETKQDKRE